METYPEEELIFGDLRGFFSALGSKSARPSCLHVGKKNNEGKTTI